MTNPPRRVAVMGAGTMGAQIAAHLANVGIPTLLLDLPAKEEGSAQLADAALAGLTRIKPSPLFLPSRARFIETGNFRDDLERVSQCDWIIEAVVENLEIKRDLWRKVAPLRNPNALLSTNTSGLPLAAIADGFGKDFQRQFLGTHFFNPPRYMHLLEIIPGPGTAPEVLARMEEIGDRFLGKGVVHAKDQPNFIANRIGVFVGARAGRLREELGLKVEDVDALTGPLIGRPKTGTFRLGDLVGNDVMLMVCQNLHENLPDDPWRQIFQGDSLLRNLVAQGRTGRKSGAGYYKKEGSTILVIDPETLDYREQSLTDFPSLEEARRKQEIGERIRTLISVEDAAGRFLWSYLRDTWAYAAWCTPTIADQIFDVDRALRWGFNWSHGPFELWDESGPQGIAERIQSDGLELPEWTRQAVAGKGFYPGDGERTYFDFQSGTYECLAGEPEKLQLVLLKEAKPPVLQSPEASLVDLGEGIACFEFHSKMNSLSEAMVEFSSRVRDEVEQNFDGLVVSNQGQDFSVGANLLGLLRAIDSQAWDELEQAVRRFQEMTRSFRYSPKPVVAAPFGRTLAGGAEVCLGCDLVVASAETYMGLVEVGVGLIPAGGGTTEILIRCTSDPQEDLEADRSAGLEKAFQTIGMAKVSGSAEEARTLDLLSPRDEIEIQRERLLWVAKQRVLSLLRSGYQMPLPPSRIPVTGQAGLALLRVGLHLMCRAEFISDHDQRIGDRLAYVLSGGDLNQASYVSEQFLLDLEREAFLSLCGEPKTQDRIQFMLEKGKPLRN